MIIKALSANAAAIYLSTDELDDDADGCSLHALIRRAQASRGLPVWDSMDASLFVNGDKILLLAWPTQTLVFSFPDFERLLSAALRCPEGTPSSLTYMDESWRLIVHCVLGRAPSVLYEFGTLLCDGEALSAHIREHGETVLLSDAVAFLQRAFQ